MRRIVSLFVPLLLAGTVGAPLAAGAAPPKVAVLNFSTVGLTSNWYGQFEPGVALSDLVTDQMVNSGKFDMLDRKNLDATLNEHHLQASGEVDPATAINAGRLVGARYLISGNILQLDHTGSSGAAVGSAIGGIAGGLIGGVRSDRVTLKVAVRVVDAQTGRIVQSFSDEKTESATSFGGGGYSGWTAGSYGNQQFLSSSMGHLINDEAIAIATHLDPTKFTAGPPPISLSGHVIDVDGASIIINLGASKGVTVGSYFDVVKVKQIRDPDSGKYLTVNENVGKIEIMQVNADTAVGRVVSGKIVRGAAVTSE
ncbi:MAG TPA: CsgG/HfaB family protein [Candidatus Baltobacteraceae bacterium]|nr:CsgG/HfaB family protein [Candidatus Baltobacteraceae bacterium]